MMDACTALIFFLPVIVKSLPVPIPIAENMVDMTHDLVGHGAMPKWPGHRGYDFTIDVRGKYKDSGVYVELNSISLSEHTATHMDAPAHFGKPAGGSNRLHQIPKKDFVAEGVVVDIRPKVKSNKDYELNVDDLKEWEEKYGRIPQRSFVFMYSGWEKFWSNKTAFLGTNDFNDMSSLHSPGFSGQATKWLIDERNILGIGSDTVSLDTANSKTFDSHRYLLTEKNLFGFEMVASLSSLPPRGATIYAFPMKIYDGSGAPVRMFAFWNNSSSTFRTSYISYILVLFTIIMLF